MSLRLSSFQTYLNGGDPIDLLECRLGESFVIPFTISNNATPPVPVDLTGWVFTVSYCIYTATFKYDGSGNLTKVTDVQAQLPSATDAGLYITDIDPLSGTGTLVIPPNINPDPTVLVTANGCNTMLNVITIDCVYPSSVVGVNQTRKIMLGLVVRIGE
jgi:hypothetical protein